LLLGGAIVPAGAATGPQAYPAPGGMRHNDDFTVRVRSSGADWVDLFEHDVIVDLDAPQHATMVQFDMDGPVEVEVRRNNGDVHSVVARPARAGVVPVLAGNVARFRLTRPAKLSIEFDGDRLHNLHLFASAAGAAPTVPAGRSVVRFAPGFMFHPISPGQCSLSRHTPRCCWSRAPCCAARSRSIASPMCRSWATASSTSPSAGLK
jgi:hypothetical protein